MKWCATELKRGPSLQLLLMPQDMIGYKYDLLQRTMYQLMQIVCVALPIFIYIALRQKGAM